MANDGPPLEAVHRDSQHLTVDAGTACDLHPQEAADLTTTADDDVGANGNSHELAATFQTVASGIDADRAARPNQTPVVVIPPVVSQSDAIAGDLNGESMRRIIRKQKIIELTCRKGFGRSQSTRIVRTGRC